MEEPETRAENRSLEPLPRLFTTHRPSHLRSRTYCTLVHILSQCHGQSQVSLATPLASEELIRSVTDNKEPQQVTEKEDFEHGQAVVPHKVGQMLKLPEATNTDIDSQDLGFVERGLSKTQLVIEEIEKAMQVDENEDIVKQKDLIVDDADKLLDEGFGLQQMLMDEFELIMNGNGEQNQDNNIDLLETLLEENQSVVDMVSSLNSENHQSDLQDIVMDELEGSELQVVEGHCNLLTSETFDSHLDKGVTNEKSRPVENKEDKTCYLKTDSLESNLETHQKAMGWENEISTDVTLPSTSMIEDGEISGDFRIDGELSDMPVGVSVSPNKKVEEKQMAEHKIEFPSRTRRKGPKASSFTIDGNTGGALEHKQDATNRTLLKYEFVYETAITTNGECRDNCTAATNKNKRKSIDGEGIDSEVTCPNNVKCGDNVEQTTNNKPTMQSQEKVEDAGSHARKRSSSKEAKARKKLKERKKRAEKNFQLGVRKLKLRPVQKSKPVSYCRHYINGRCHKGEECNFSHDTIPLTKSKPCSYFARNECMKGDDCQFDHDLSKYSCTSHFIVGFCRKGDNCMFSHKIPPKDETLPASDACGPETTHQHVDVSSNSPGGISGKSSKSNVIDALPKPPALPTKGFSSLSTGNSMIKNSKPYQGNPYPMTSASGKVETKTSETINVTTMRTPSSVRPKGLNFLSFDKSSSRKSSVKEDGVNLSLSKIQSSHEQSISLPKKDDTSILQSQATQNVSGTNGKSNDILKNIQPVVAQKGIHFLSAKKDIIQQASLPSDWDKGVKVPGQANIFESDKHQKLRSAVMNSGKSIDQLKPKDNKVMPNTTQKTLGLYEQSSSSSKKIDNIKFSNQTTLENSGDILKKNTQPVLGQKRMRSFSFGRDNDKQTISPSSLERGVSTPVHENVNVNANASDKHNDTNSVSKKLAAILNRGESLEQSKHGQRNSAQKALMSALSFASKFESNHKVNNKAKSSLVASNSEAKDNNVPQGSKSDTAKILKFLSSFSSKTKE